MLSSFFDREILSIIFDYNVSQNLNSLSEYLYKIKLFWPRKKTHFIILQDNWVGSVYSDRICICLARRNSKLACLGRFLNFLDRLLNCLDRLLNCLDSFSIVKIGFLIVWIALCGSVGSFLFTSKTPVRIAVLLFWLRDF